MHSDAVRTRHRCDVLGENAAAQPAQGNGLGISGSVSHAIGQVDGGLRPGAVPALRGGILAAPGAIDRIGAAVEDCTAVLVAADVSRG